MNLKKLKKANKIYETLANKTIDRAMAALNTYDDIDQEVLHLVKSLITNSAESNTYFDQKIAKQYQNPISNNWHVGMTIDGYELTEVIGKGGMSIVFKAIRTDSTTQKPVAIKIFNLTNQNPEIKTKFLVEQHILAGLSHPNIIDFHHGKNIDQGDPYLVMEFLDEGLSIKEYIQNKQLTTRAIIELILQAAEALQYAHNHLVIHRDVKPSNLMVNKNGILKVLDFGIAKLIDNKAVTDSAEDTILALTPSFAAPEQINTENIDVTTDIYSLAAVTLSLLANQLPFPSDRMIKSCQNDEAHANHLLKQHLDDHDLTNILRKALKKAPHDRYANMYAFSADLQAWLAKKPVTATKNSWWYRLQRFAIRRTALFVTSVVLGVTVIAAVVGLSYQNQAIKHEAEKAEAVKKFMLDAFSVTDPNYAQGVDISSKDLLHVAAKKITADEAMDADIKFELYLAMSLAHGRLGFYPEAIKLLNKALEIDPQHEQAIALLANYQFNAGQIEAVNVLLERTQEDLFKSNEQKAAIKRVRASVYAQAGKHEQAIAEFKRLAKLSQNTSDIIANQTLLAEIHYLNGNSAKSITILEALKQHYPLPATDVTNLKLNADLVQYHDRMGNFTAAMTLTQKNITAFKNILGEQHPDLGLAYNSLSVFQRLAGKLDEAITSAQISEQIFRQRYGETSEGLAQALSNLGAAYYFKKQPESAIAYLTQADDMLTAIFGVNHPETMSAKYNLATILNATNKPHKALPILQNMYKIEVNSLGKSHRSALFTQRSLALTSANSGQYEQAIFHANESLKLLKQHHPDKPVDINNAYSVLGQVYFMSGNYQIAIEQFKHFFNNWTDGNKNNYARILHLMAQSHQKLEQHQAATEYYQRWTDHLKNIYGETDIKYLEGLLESAEKSKQMKHLEHAKTRLSQVQKILVENNLNLPEIKTKLAELKH